MGKLAFDATGQRYYQTGVSKVVLYTKTGTNGAYANGVAWNGVTSIAENPSGGEPSPLYADNIKYLNLMSNEEFGGQIDAYYYPVEFGVCDGSANYANGVTITGQPRKEFGLCYRTEIGNDVDGINKGYRLHLVYGALAAPSGKTNNTINNNPDANTFSWTFSTTAVEIPPVVSGSTTLKFKPTAHLIIDSTDPNIDEDDLKELEDNLYGRDASTGTTTVTELEPTLLMPAEVLAIVGAISVG